MSGFKTQKHKSGAYQSVKPDNHNTIISNLWLFIGSWFHIVGWTHQYNTLFREIMRAVSFVAVLNHLAFKEITKGAILMLVLTRKKNQKIYIGHSIVITHLGCDGQTVKLGIQAPPQVMILREELTPMTKDTNGGAK